MHGARGGAAIVGRNGKSNYAGILIPYMWPGEPYAREYRLRLDYPEFEQKSDGSTKPKYRYLCATGSRNMLYLAPGTLPEWLDDTDLPIILTEGEKKCLALSDLAWYAAGDAAERPAWLSVAISGVRNWHGVVGKDVASDGTRVNVKGPISDLSRVNWKARAVTLLFDADVHSNPDVKIARYAVAKELRSDNRKARISFLDIPLDCRVKGVDDLIGVWGQARVLDLIRNSRYDPKEKVNGREYPTPNGAEPDTFGPKSLSERLGICKATAHRNIDRLSHGGVISKVGYGEYRLSV
jgi:hypothetical protein